MKIDTVVPALVNTVEQVLKKEMQQVGVKYNGSPVTYKGYIISNVGGV